MHDPSLLRQHVSYINDAQIQEQKKSIILYENVLNLIVMAPQLERCAVLYVTCLTSTAHSHTIVTEFSGSSCHHSESESPLLTARPSAGIVGMSQSIFACLARLFSNSSPPTNAL